VSRNDGPEPGVERLLAAQLAAHGLKDLLRLALMDSGCTFVTAISINPLWGDGGRAIPTGPGLSRYDFEFAATGRWIRKLWITQAIINKVPHAV